MKNTILPVLALVLISVLFILENPKRSIENSAPDVNVAPGIGTETDRFARFNYMKKILADPATGEIPPFMRQRELLFHSVDATVFENDRWL